jgi:hypothetical protein
MSPVSAAASALEEVWLSICEGTTVLLSSYTVRAEDETTVEDVDNIAGGSNTELSPRVGVGGVRRWSGRE